MAALRKRHYWPLWIGLLIPIAWIIGALIAPTERIAGTAPRMA
jgi:hypothetical protein